MYDYRGGGDHKMISGLENKIQYQNIRHVLKFQLLFFAVFFITIAAVFAQTPAYQPPSCEDYGYECVPENQLSQDYWRFGFSCPAGEKCQDAKPLSKYECVQNGNKCADMACGYYQEKVDQECPDYYTSRPIVCCREVEYAGKPSLSMKEKTYYTDDMITYRLDVPYQADCQVNLINPQGNEIKQSGGGCPPSGEEGFQSSYFLKNNYGKWGLKIIIHKDGRNDVILTDEFEYKYVNREVQDCSIDPRKQNTCSFLGTDYIIQHIEGCGPNTAVFKVRYGSNVQTIYLEEGEKITLRNGVDFRLKGAGCGASQFPISLEKEVPEVADDKPTDSFPKAERNVLGDPGAPVTIEMFTDLECPFCNRWHQDTFPEINDNYIEAGKVRLVVKHFPLSFHTNANNAAIAAECAAKAGGDFFEYIDMVYGNANSLSEDKLIEFSEDIGGVNKNEFNECYSGKLPEKIIQSDIEEGKRRGVSGTPTFFVNGYKVAGAQPYQGFKDTIEKALNGNLPDNPDIPTKRPIDGPIVLPKQEQCDGCNVLGTCMDVGIRAEKNGAPVYCDLSSELLAQKMEGAICQNNYECLSNQCSNGQCIDIQRELKETKGILESLFSWLRSIFSS